MPKIVWKSPDLPTTPQNERLSKNDLRIVETMPPGRTSGHWYIVESHDGSKDGMGVEHWILANPTDTHRAFVEWVGVLQGRK